MNRQIGNDGNEHLDLNGMRPTIPAGLLGPKKVPTGDR